MDVRLAYFGRSQLVSDVRGAQLLSFAPNLARDPVAFDAPLRSPLRFREAISALHDVVINDLRFKPRDKTAYEEWKRQEAARQEAIRRQVFSTVKTQVLAAHGKITPELEQEFERCRRKYWRARDQYSNILRQHDPALWRTLMPCDPVVTVSEDVVFFECFSADESSYGCLTVNRDGGFGPSPALQFGTTNVDYSWDLYRHFQALRTYRETRFRVDPQGFEVATAGNAEYREEKIDLPAGWLRGFLQIQAAMGLPMRKVSLSREAVYSLLAWLKRHRARRSPRALRFELVNGAAPRLVLEPWEQAVVSRGAPYRGPGGEPIRIWGTRRLLVLARLLPLVEEFEVHLLGTGLPSFWVAKMGEMRLTVGISGWTTNDWTRGSALDNLLPASFPPAELINRIAQFVRGKQSATFDEIRSQMVTSPAECAAALNHLARTGQLIHDLDARRFRWRQVMARPLGEADIGPENEEMAQARGLVARGKVKLTSRQDDPSGKRLLVGNADGKPVELLLDADGVIKRGKCLCGHHRKAGLRMGPCRHLLALRQAVLQGTAVQTQGWYERLQKFVGN